MSDYHLLAWGANNTSNLSTYKSTGAFWLEVEFDVGQQVDQCLTYLFLVANPAGFLEFATHNLLPGEPYLSLKKVVIMHEYNYDSLLSFLREEVENKCREYDNSQLLTYLRQAFGSSED